MATHPKIRLGTASPSPLLTTAETLPYVATLARRAAARGVDILLLPEAFIGGYPRGTAFGCVVGGRSDEGRDEYLAYFREAVDLGDVVGDGGAGGGDAWVKRELNGKKRDGEEQERRGDGRREELERIAKETGVFIVVGVIERAGGSLYCSVVHVCPNLGMIGKRRKVLPTATERLIWAQGSPATLKAISTTIKGVRINLAAAICWENYMPLLRQSLYAQNINLYLAPTADGRDTWLSLMRTIGIEGRCFVVSSNMCIRDKKQDSGTVNGQQQHLDETEETRQDRASDPTKRRNSCMTEDGFEIALPSPALHKAKGNRRRSVFDEDGNEIVLCHKEGDEGRASANENGASTRQRLVKQMASQSNTTITKGSFISRGGSSIVSPFGDVIAGPQWEDEDGIIFADVDFDDCIRGRLDLDTAGSYSRNDAFKLTVQGLDMTPLPY